MAIIEKFIIENFKGIESVNIDLQDRTNCPVITLIGLNESGKTTILEALSHFVSGDKSVAELFDGVHSKTHGAALIPVNKKAAFSSEIKITALIQLTQQDVDEIVILAKKLRFEVDTDSLLKPFRTYKSYKFEDSVLTKTMNYWLFDLQTRKNKSSQFKKYARPSPTNDSDLWKIIVDLLVNRLPQISYFPTFLVDMPSKIYLKEHEGEKAINRHYRIVFQDILDSLNENLSLDRHVTQRISEFRDAQKSPNWFSMFYGSSSKAPIDSVFQKISNAVTKEVIGSWQRVFQRAISAKSIHV